MERMDWRYGERERGTWVLARLLWSRRGHCTPDRYIDDHEAGSTVVLLVLCDGESGMCVLFHRTFSLTYTPDWLCRR